MAMYKPYRVNTNVMLDQTRAIIDALKASGHRDGLDAIKKQGLDPDLFIADLSQALDDGATAESLQERLKARYVEEASQDQEIAERGYRWILRGQAKGRHAVATLDDPPDIAGRLRFGKTRSSRARGVVYNMRIMIPELEDLQSVLAPFGVDQAFIDEGKKILADLGVDRAETEEVKAERKRVTQDVRAAKKRLSQLLRRLETADQAAALERIDAKRYFTLDIIHAELARLSAARDARAAARSVSKGTPIDPIDE